MVLKSIYYTIAVVDIEKFGRRTNPDQQWLRRQMYDVLEAAATQAGIPWSQCPKADRGDGVFILIPTSVPKEDITDGFVRELSTALGAYSRRSSESVAMRMRIALHAGDVARDDQGWVGAELNTACRLVDLQALRDALGKIPSALLALIVSDMWFKTVVRHDPGAVDHRDYTRVPIAVKELNDWAWIHLLGFSKPQAPKFHSSEDPDEIPNETITPDVSKHAGKMIAHYNAPINTNKFVGRDEISYIYPLKSKRPQP